MVLEPLCTICVLFKQSPFNGPSAKSSIVTTVKVSHEHQDWYQDNNGHFLICEIELKRGVAFQHRRSPGGSAFHPILLADLPARFF